MKNLIYIIGALIVLLFATYPITYYFSEDTTTITVKRKERITGENSSKYLIYTK